MRHVVQQLDLTLEPGVSVAFVGPNGSGKTTVLRCVAGTLTPSRGSVRIGRHEAGSFAARQLIGASFSQERSFYLRLTGRANLIFFARLRHGTKRAAERDVDRVIAELAIPDIAAERVDRCSTGMVQQLAIARSLLGQPRILLLDEPTRSLDRAARSRLWEMIEGRSELAVVIASHLDEDLERCGLRVDFPT